MADDAALEEAPAEAKKRDRGILLPIVGAVLVSVLLSVGGTIGGLAYFGVLDSDDAGEQTVDGEGNPLPDEPTAEAGVEVIPLKKFQANLKDGAGGRQISLDISLEGHGKDGESSLEAVVAEREAAIRDAVNFLLMDFTYAELRGTDGMLRLRDTIHRRIGEVVGTDGEVKRVYFTDVVVQ